MATGAADSIGSKSCERLTDGGHAVLTVNYTWTGSSPDVLLPSPIFDPLRRDCRILLDFETDLACHPARLASPLSGVGRPTPS